MVFDCSLVQKKGTVWSGLCLDSMFRAATRPGQERDGRESAPLAGQGTQEAGWLKGSGEAWEEGGGRGPSQAHGEGLAESAALGAAESPCTTRGETQPSLALGLQRPEGPRLSPAPRHLSQGCPREGR